MQTLGRKQKKQVGAGGRVSYALRFTLGILSCPPLKEMPDQHIHIKRRMELLHFPKHSKMEAGQSTGGSLPVTLSSCPLTSGNISQVLSFSFIQTPKQFSFTNRKKHLFCFYSQYENKFTDDLKMDLRFYTDDPFCFFGLFFAS